MHATNRVRIEERAGEAEIVTVEAILGDQRCAMRERGLQGNERAPLCLVNARRFLAQGLFILGGETNRIPSVG